MGKAPLFENVRRCLRGSHNSIRHRFIGDPMERLSLFVHTTKGGTYLDWYAKRLDKFARETAQASKDSPRWKRFVEHYMARKPYDLEILKSFGMLPEHKLHEFGMGFGRAAQYFIDYLNCGNFSANDSSGERVSLGLEYLRERNLLAEKEPLVVVNTDNTFDWVNDRKVDFIWAFSVFGHMPPDDVREVILNMKSKIMHEDTIFLFTIANLEVDTVTDATESKYVKQAPSERDRTKGVKRESVKDWWHLLDWYRAIGDEYGLEFEDVSEVLKKGGFDPASSLVKMTIAKDAGQ